MFKLVVICSVFGLPLALGSGEAVAQSMSSSNCMAMGPNMVHCDTMDMTPSVSPPQPPQNPAPAEPASRDSTADLPPQDNKYTPLRDTLGAIGDAFLKSGGQQPQYETRKQMYEARVFRMKVGKMLADGDCQGAARFAFENGQLELGQSITATCKPNNATAVNSPPF